MTAARLFVFLTSYVLNKEIQKFEIQCLADLPNDMSWAGRMQFTNFWGNYLSE